MPVAEKRRLVVSQEFINQVKEAEQRELTIDLIRDFFANLITEMKANNEFARTVIDYLVSSTNGISASQYYDLAITTDSTVDDLDNVLKRKMDMVPDNIPVFEIYKKTFATVFLEIILLLTRKSELVTQTS